MRTDTLERPPIGSWIVILQLPHSAESVKYNKPYVPTRMRAGETGGIEYYHFASKAEAAEYAAHYHHLNPSICKVF